MLEDNKDKYADLYKKITETFFLKVNQDFSYYMDLRKDPLNMGPTKLTFTNIEYCDGYFILEMGENSVVNFNIAELPGWKFGIWWNDPVPVYESEKRKKITGMDIKGDFFAQYEDNIDKFKPSASAIGNEINIILNTDLENITNINEEEITCFSYNVAHSLIFIMKEPELAFCRDLYFWDYNEEYHSRSEAKKLYKQHIEHIEKEKRITAELNEKMLNKVKELFKAELDSGALFIRDCGEHHSPRYDFYGITSELEKSDKIYTNGECGHYWLWSFVDTEVKKEYDKTYNECKKIAKKNKITWYTELSDCITLTKQKGENTNDTNN